MFSLQQRFHLCENSQILAPRCIFSINGQDHLSGNYLDKHGTNGHCDDFSQAPRNDFCKFNREAEVYLKTETRLCYNFWGFPVFQFSNTGPSFLHSHHLLSPAFVHGHRWSSSSPWIKIIKNGETLLSPSPPGTIWGQVYMFCGGYRLEGNRSPQNGDICGSRDEIGSRNWGHSTVGSTSGFRLLISSRGHYDSNIHHLIIQLKKRTLKLKYQRNWCKTMCLID